MTSTEHAGVIQPDQHVDKILQSCLFEQCQAVLFDLDGTLIDSVDVWFHIVNAACKHFDKPAIERDIWLTRSGTSIESNVALFFGDLTVEQFNQFADEKYCDYLCHLKLMDGSIELLHHCQSVFGSSIALVSNCPHSIADLVLKHFKIDHYFHHVVCAGDQAEKPLQPKPAPDIVTHACELFHVSPSDAVLIGDSHYDVEAAKAAKCLSIGVGVTGGEARADTMHDVIRFLPVPRN